MSQNRTSGQSDSLPALGIAAWYAAALLVGLLPILNSLFGLLGVIGVMAGLIVIAALALPLRHVTLHVLHLGAGLIVAGTAWWLVSLALFRFSE